MAEFESHPVFAGEKKLKAPEQPADEQFRRTIARLEWMRDGRQGPEPFAEGVDDEDKEQTSLLDERASFDPHRKFVMEEFIAGVLGEPRTSFKNTVVRESEDGTRLTIYNQPFDDDYFYFFQIKEKRKRPIIGVAAKPMLDEWEMGYYMTPIKGEWENELIEEEEADEGKVVPFSPRTSE